MFTLSIQTLTSKTSLCFHRQRLHFLFIFNFFFRFVCWELTVLSWLFICPVYCSGHCSRFLVNSSLPTDECNCILKTQIFNRNCEDTLRRTACNFLRLYLKGCLLFLYGRLRMAQVMNIWKHQNYIFHLRLASFSFSQTHKMQINRQKS